MWMIIAIVSLVLNVILLLVLVAYGVAESTKEEFETKLAEAQMSKHVIDVPPERNKLWEKRLRTLWEERPDPEEHERTKALVDSFDGRVKRLERNSGLNV